MMTPGLPSKVSFGGTIFSIAASAGLIIIEVPKPVAALAAVNAHSVVAAVIRTREIHILKPSAKVSSISTFSSFMIFHS